jgi:hypothetical protein
MDGMEPPGIYDLPMTTYDPGAGPGGNHRSEIVGHESEIRRHDERKKELARDFESVLLARLFDEVKESIGQWNFEDDDDGTSQQVHGLFWLYLAQDVADKGGLGLWQDIYRHFNAIEGALSAGRSVDRKL